MAFAALPLHNLRLPFAGAAAGAPSSLSALLNTTSPEAVAVALLAGVLLLTYALLTRCAMSPIFGPTVLWLHPPQPQHSSLRPCTHAHLHTDRRHLALQLAAHIAITAALLLHFAATAVGPSMTWTRCAAAAAAAQPKHAACCMLHATVACCGLWLLLSPVPQQVGAQLASPPTNTTTTTTTTITTTRSLAHGVMPSPSSATFWSACALTFIARCWSGVTHMVAFTA